MSLTKVATEHVLYPLSTRVGTAVAFFLVGIGANEAHANIVGLGVGAAMLVACDLALAWYRHRAIKRKAVSDAGTDPK